MSQKKTLLAVKTQGIKNAAPRQKPASKRGAMSATSPRSLPSATMASELGCSLENLLPFLIANARDSTDTPAPGWSVPSGRETTTPRVSAETPRTREPTPIRARPRPNYPASTRTAARGLSEPSLSGEEAAFWVPIAENPGHLRSQFLRPSPRQQPGASLFSYLPPNPSTSVPCYKRVR